MSVIVAETDVVRQFDEYLNRVTSCRESFVIMRGETRIAELRPLPAERALGDLPALFEALPRLSAADAASFGEDLDVSREALGQPVVRDAWRDLAD